MTDPGEATEPAAGRSDAVGLLIGGPGCGGTASNAVVGCQGPGSAEAVPDGFGSPPIRGLVISRPR